MKVLALVCLLALGAPEPTAPEVRRYAGWVPGAAPGNVAVVQVLDAATGLPVAGARVAQYDENAGNGFLGATLLAETTTDTFGLASVRWASRPYDCHWVFEAPGYVVLEEYGEFPPDRVWLGRGGTMSARLLGPFGTPVAGADVELFLGCGHSPAVRRARTGPDGRFRFDGVRPGSGRLWFVVPGLASRDVDMGNVLAAGDDATIIADPGFVLGGRVVDVKGEPVQNAVVGARTTSRGPATETGPKGEFRLVGVAYGEDLYAYHERFRDFEAPFLPSHLPLDRGPIRLVMPDGDETPDDALDMLGVEGVTVPVRFVGPDGKEIPWFEFRLRNLADGMTYESGEETDEDLDETERIVVVAPPGEYEILPTGPFTERLPRPARVTVTPERTEPVVVVATLRPVLHLTFGRRPDEDSSDIDLLVPRGVASIDLDEIDEEPVRLPAAGPAVLRVRADGIVRLFPVGPAKDGLRRVTIDWPEPKTIRVPLPADLGVDLGNTGFADRVTLGRFAFTATREGAELVLRTRATGRAVLEIEAKNDHRATMVVEVPAEPGATIRTDPPRFQPPEGDVGPIRLAGPDGEPIAEAAVRVVRDGRQSHGKTQEDGTYAAKGFSGSIRHGGWFDSEVMKRKFAAPPAFLEVDGWPTRLLRPGRPGPLEVRYPAGALDLRVRDADGTPLRFAVVLDGLPARGGEGALVLRGVEPGRRTVIVGTPEHGARLALVDVPAQGAARLDLVLPKEE